MRLRVTRVDQLLLKNINPAIKLLIAADMLIVGASGMFGPMFALFVTDFIQGGNELVAGIAMSVYLIIRSVFQIPVATFIDKIKGERDDHFLMTLFSFISGVCTLLYIFIDTPFKLYMLQAILGLCAAITYPSFMAIFTRHIDTHKEGTEWGMYYTFVDLCTAALTSIGGYVAKDFGFINLIIVVSVVTLLGAALLIPLKNFIYKPKKFFISSLFDND